MKKFFMYLLGAVVILIAIVVAMMLYGEYEYAKRQEAQDRAELEFPDLDPGLYIWQDEYRRIQIRTKPDSRGIGNLRKVTLKGHETDVSYVVAASLNSEGDTSVTVAFHTPCQPGTEIVTELTYSDGAPKKLYCGYEGGFLMHSFKYTGLATGYGNTGENLGGFEYEVNFGEWDFSPLERELTLLKAKAISD